MIELPISYLRELFDADFETGTLTWRVRPVSHFKDGARQPAAWNANNWNAKRAGTVAGSPDGKGYLKVMIDGVQYKTHRIMWALAHGDWPIGEIDYANGVRDDNRLCNLSVVSQTENGRNQKARGGSSKYPGVTWHKRDQKWQARIVVDGVPKHLGMFTDELAAAAAYRREAERNGFTRRHITATDGTIAPRRLPTRVDPFDISPEMMRVLRSMTTAA